MKPIAFPESGGAAPCCGATSLDVVCRYSRRSGSPEWRFAPLIRGVGARTAHAQWALANGATIDQAVSVSGVAEYFVRDYAKRLWAARD